VTNDAVIIETPRLHLRCIQERHFAAFAAMNADPAVMEFFPAPFDYEQSVAMRRRMERHMEEHGHGFWVAESRENREFLGIAGLLVPRFEAHFTPCVEIGWRFARKHWGKGLASEAARSLVDFGFTRLRLDEIVAMTVPDNRRSRRVMERLGMTYSPADDFDLPDLPEGHPLRRHVLYRLARRAWHGPPGG
jgi:RimJ/RimL family protein N-acetyltransferase